MYFLLCFCHVKISETQHRQYRKEWSKGDGHKHTHTQTHTHTHTHTKTHTHTTQQQHNQTHRHTTHTHKHEYRSKARGMPRDMQSHDVVIDTHHSEPLTAQRKSITSLCLTRHVSNAHRMALGRTLTHLHTHEHLN